MHFKREKTIAGADFVAVPKQWLEDVLTYLVEQPMIDVAVILHEASSFGDLDNLPNKEAAA
jgi:hypothetical protein